MQNRSVQNSKEDCPTLLCKSFDDQYKRVQSFRNQYLNMIRIILKMQSNNKFPHLTMEDILAYNEIENKINTVNTEIVKLTQNIKKKYNLSNSNFNQNLNTNPVYTNLTASHQSVSSNITDDDIRMAQTFVAFLPLMIYYYNSLNLDNLNATNVNTNANNININIMQQEPEQYIDNFVMNIPLD
jgi:hypothetical protein